MTELEISINSASNEPEKEFRAILGNFEEQHHTKVICTLYDWTTAWSEIMKIMLYKHGPVMSQVGSTWLGSLEATQGRWAQPGSAALKQHRASVHSPPWKSISLAVPALITRPHGNREYPSKRDG
jgi:hypothetical protein